MQACNKSKTRFASGSTAYIQERQLSVLAETRNALKQSVAYSSKASQSRHTAPEPQGPQGGRPLAHGCKINSNIFLSGTLIDNTSGRYLGTKGRQNRDQSLPKFCSHKCQICRAEINCIMCARFQDNTTYTDTWNYPSLKRTHTHIYIYT